MQIEGLSHLQSYYRACERRGRAPFGKCLYLNEHIERICIEELFAKIKTNQPTNQSGRSNTKHLLVCFCPLAIEDLSKLGLLLRLWPVTQRREVVLGMVGVIEPAPQSTYPVESSCNGLCPIDTVRHANYFPLALFSWSLEEISKKAMMRHYEIGFIS